LQTQRQLSSWRFLVPENQSAKENSLEKNQLYGKSPLKKTNFAQKLP